MGFAFYKFRFLFSNLSAPKFKTAPNGLPRGFLQKPLAMTTHTPKIHAFLTLQTLIVGRLWICASASRHFAQTPRLDFAKPRNDTFLVIFTPHKNSILHEFAKPLNSTLNYLIQRFVIFFKFSRAFDDGAYDV